jgi:hypothetical protein
MSFGGGGWISRFGRAETNSDADAESVRRIVGTALDGRRATGFFAGAEDVALVVLVEAMGWTVGGVAVRALTWAGVGLATTTCVGCVVMHVSIATFHIFHQYNGT